MPDPRKNRNTKKECFCPKCKGAFVTLQTIRNHKREMDANLANLQEDELGNEADGSEMGQETGGESDSGEEGRPHKRSRTLDETAEMHSRTPPYEPESRFVPPERPVLGRSHSGLLPGDDLSSTTDRNENIDPTHPIINPFEHQRSDSSSSSSSSFSRSSPDQTAQPASNLSTLFSNSCSATSGVAQLPKWVSHG
ncbi:hypothetical protein K435DRAFT_841990 [Dendrothele bispora CBS 962.96]|uniref:Uncharacterized protein n=1 Tax=Dendrothele bispora (strain CBS 962.96) TaxID=1314807 RepID=A0A4S8LIR8_DENBC|nr:hypothetical protein K435DRAFT_841990 [Dendrothele bispora CBS 962.96]